MADAVLPGARRLSLPTRFFYGFGSVAFGVKDNGFSYFLQFFYAQVVGIPAATVGLAIMFALVIDAFIDPVVGQLSDNVRSRWGRRHPFMYAAALPVGLSYLLLWNPPQDWSQPALVAYLIVVAILIRSFITGYEVPSSALAAELTTEYDERTKLLSYRYLFGWMGGLTMYFLALTVFLRPDAAESVGQLNREGYAHYGLFAAGLMIFAILTSAIGTHRQIPNLRAPPHETMKLGRLAKELIGTLSHRTFLFILSASFFNSMAIGLGFSINLYFSTYFWEFNATEIALFTFSSLIAAMLAFWAAPRIASRVDKKPAAMALLAVQVVFIAWPVLARLAGVFVSNESPAIFGIIFVNNIIAVGTGITGNILFSSMIADVVEDSELRTGRRQEGVFFAASLFVQKAVTGAGIFVTGLIISGVQFPQGVKPGEVPAEVLRNLGLVYVPTAAALYGMAVLLLLGYRITRKGHQETLRKLAAAADLATEGEPPGSAAKLS